MHGKVNYLIKIGVFLFLVIIHVPPKILDSLIFNINAVVLIVVIC